MATHSPPRHYVMRIATAIAFALLGSVAALGAASGAAAQSTSIGVQVGSPGTLVPGTTLTATATPGVVRVEYTLETRPGYSFNRYFLAQSTAAPFSAQWNGTPSALPGGPNDYLLVATAYDASGRSVRSDAVVGGIQRRTSVTVPGTWATVRNRAFASLPPALSGGAVTRGQIVDGGVVQAVTTLPAAGGSATYTLKASAAARFEVHIAHQVNAGNAAVEIRVNGIAVASSRTFATPTLQSGVTGVSTVSANLQAGNNTVTITSTGANGPSLLAVYAAQQ
jgi:hypothetical protein